MKKNNKSKIIYDCYLHLHLSINPTYKTPTLLSSYILGNIFGNGDNTLTLTGTTINVHLAATPRTLLFPLSLFLYPCTLSLSLFPFPPPPLAICLVDVSLILYAQVSHLKNITSPILNDLVFACASPQNSISWSKNFQLLAIAPSLWQVKAGHLSSLVRKFLRVRILFYNVDKYLVGSLREDILL